MASDQIGIVVADDHQVVRAGFAALLATQPDFRVLGTATDGAESAAVSGESPESARAVTIHVPGEELGRDGKPDEAAAEPSGEAGAADGVVIHPGLVPSLEARARSLAGSDAGRESDEAAAEAL